MCACYMWWLWQWWCNQLLSGHRVRAGGDAPCALATCGDCGNDDAINYFRGTELEQGVMPHVHLLHVVIVVMMMYWNVFRAQSLSRGQCPLHTCYVWWLWWWCNELFAGHGVWAGGGVPCAGTVWPGVSRGSAGRVQLVSPDSRQKVRLGQSCGGESQQTVGQVCQKVFVFGTQ